MAPHTPSISEVGSDAYWARHYCYASFTSPGENPFDPQNRRAITPQLMAHAEATAVYNQRLIDAPPTPLKWSALLTFIGILMAISACSARWFQVYDVPARLAYFVTPTTAQQCWIQQQRTFDPVSGWFGCDFTDPVPLAGSAPLAAQSGTAFVVLVILGGIFNGVVAYARLCIRAPPTCSDCCCNCCCKCPSWGRPSSGRTAAQLAIACGVNVVGLLLLLVAARGLGAEMGCSQPATCVAVLDGFRLAAAAAVAFGAAMLLTLYHAAQEAQNDAIEAAHKE